MSSEPDKKLHASLPSEVAARSREAEHQRPDTVAVNIVGREARRSVLQLDNGNSLMGLDDHRSPDLERGLKNAACCWAMLKHAEHYLMAGAKKQLQQDTVLQKCKRHVSSYWHLGRSQLNHPPKESKHF